MADTATLTLNDVLDRNTILTDVKVETKEDVFRTLAERLFEQGYVSSVDDFCTSAKRKAPPASAITLPSLTAVARL